MDFNPDTLLQRITDDTRYIDSELAFYRVQILKKSVLKKYVRTSDSAIHLDRAARDDFINRNEELSKLQITYPHINDIKYQLERDLNSNWDPHYNIMDSFIRMGLLPPHGGVGPGSSIGPRENDLYEKLFVGPLTVTDESLAKFYFASLPENWRSAYMQNPVKVQVVAGNRLSSVPKDSEKSRTICTEPVLNMYFQLAAKSLLEKCLKQRYQIDISNQQDLNKDLARRGSIDGSLATIDLSNASDSISMQLCEAILPKDVFNTLKKIRSPAFVDGNTVHHMNMISTMGNGFTFPLMTLILCALCKTIASRLGIKLRKDNHGVFGDDIIVPKAMAPALLDALEQIGFKPNFDKSFISGFFKESCGGDFYHGHNVRGVYIKRMENDQDCYSAFNRLHIWSISNNINLHSTLCYLLELVCFRPVPRHEATSAGLLFPKFLLSSAKTDRNGAIFYRCTESVKSSRFVNDCTYSPFGAKISAIGGYVRNNRIARRPYGRRSIVVKKRTPCWDYANDAVLRSQDFDISWVTLLNVD